MIKYALIIIFVLCGSFFALYKTQNDTAVKMVDSIMQNVPGYVSSSGKMDITLSQKHMPYPSIFISKFNSYSLSYPYNWTFTEYLIGGVHGVAFMKNNSTAEFFIDTGPRFYANGVLCANVECDEEAGMLNISGIANNVKIVKGYKKLPEDKIETEFYRFSFYLWDPSGVVRPGKPLLYVTGNFLTKQEGTEMAKILSTLSL